MRHLIGPLLVDIPFLHGVHNTNVMPVISNFGFTLKKTEISYLKKRIPGKGIPQKPLLV